MWLLQNSFIMLSLFDPKRGPTGSWRLSKVCSEDLPERAPPCLALLMEVPPIKAMHRPSLKLGSWAPGVYESFQVHFLPTKLLARCKGKFAVCGMLPLPNGAELNREQTASRHVYCTQRGESEAGPHRYVANLEIKYEPLNYWNYCC